MPWRGGGAGVGLPILGGTSGSVIYIDSSGNLAQRNPGFTYDGSTLTLRVNGTANILRLDDSSGNLLVSINKDGTTWTTPENIAIGYGATVAGGTQAVAFGPSASSTGTQTCAFGMQANASGNAGAAFGYAANASGGLSVAFGCFAVSVGAGVALGYNSNVSVGNSVAIGQSATCSHTGSCVVGPGASSFAAFEFTSGHYSAAGQTMSFRLTGVTGDTIAKCSVFQIANTFIDASAATLKVRTVFNVFDTAAREAMRMEASGTAAKIGFLGAAAVVQPVNTDAIDTLLVNLGLRASGGSTPLDTKISKYNAITTAGWGVPAIYGSGRSTAQTGDVASVATYTVGASDGSFFISANFNVTAYTAGTQSVQCTYTDETNTARTFTFTFSNLTGTLATAIGATGPYESFPAHIRCKASTAITIKTVGTAWTGTYNVEGYITQIG